LLCTFLIMESDYNTDKFLIVDNKPT